MSVSSDTIKRKKGDEGFRATECGESGSDEFPKQHAGPIHAGHPGTGARTHFRVYNRLSKKPAPRGEEGAALGYPPIRL